MDILYAGFSYLEGWTIGKLASNYGAGGFLYWECDRFGIGLEWDGLGMG